MHRKGKKPKHIISEHKNGYLPYLLIAEIEGKPIRSYTDDVSVPIANKDDVLIVWDGSIGKTATGFYGAIGSTITALTPIIVPASFVECYLKTVKPFIEQTSRGTGLQHINPKTFWPMPFYLPPINEQKRIVEKLDAIMPRIEAVKKRLENVPVLLKRFRQSVLTAAVTGKLTEKWREEHPDVESAEENFNKYYEVIRNRKLNYNKSLKGEMPLQDVPIEWFWIKLSQTGEMGRGRSKHRPRNAPHLYGGKYPFIQTGDIANSNGLILNHKQTYSDEGLKQSKIWPEKTICITIAANIADSALLAYPACFPDSVVGIIVNEKICEIRFVEFYIRTIRENLSMFAPATAQKNINLTILSDIMFPLPHLEEQKEIVKQVDIFFAQADKVEAHYNKAKASVDKLSQSVLAKAFRGELVKNEADLAAREGRDFESAEQLLERIREEKAKKVSKKNSSKTKRENQK